MKKTLLEGPDVVVIELGWVFMNGLSQLDPEMKFFWGPILKDILPRFGGKIIFSLGIVSPFNAQICNSHHCAITWERARYARHSLAEVVNSWPPNLRQAAKSKVVVIDPAPMALPMFFDGETSMTDKTASQHWHRYERSKAPGRKVFGVVADTVGNLFLSELLRASQ
ncbi:unnamed protein product, partial [Symbiodinium pilosum]